MSEEKMHKGKILADLIRETRTIRRFRQDRPIPRRSLLEMIEAARLAGSARNLQPFKYLIVDTPEKCREVFPFLGWAGYLADWPGPEEGERPSAYIICLLDRALSDNGNFDLGIASQNLLLTATAMGYGGCRIASFSARLPAILHLPDSLQLDLVIALGVPKETVKLTTLPEDGSIRYWRDEQAVHHVPKRSMEEILVDIY